MPEKDKLLDYARWAKREVECFSRFQRLKSQIKDKEVLEALAVLEANGHGKTGCT